MGTEREPLLASGPPPTYDSLVSAHNYEVSLAASQPQRIPVIECRVCHATIDCSGRLNVSFLFQEVFIPVVL